MPVYTVHTLAKSNITISNGKDLSGITQGTGVHLVGETITLNNNSWTPIQVSDTDSSFGDSDTSQTLSAAITYDGTSYAAGLVVESEYSLTVQDPSGNTYTILAFNINEPGVTPVFGTVEGLAFIGGANGFPPTGVPLTVISNAEGPNNPYNSIAYPCFTAGCEIETPIGPVRVENLAVGDTVLTADNGPQTIRWIGKRKFSKCQIQANENLRPVRIVKGALGAELPKQDLLVSRQHRMLLRSKIAKRMFGETEVLVSAIKLTKLPGVFVDDTVESVEYIHILFDQHEIIYVEGAPTESLFTGPEALKSIPVEAREEILMMFPEITEHDYTPKSARFIPVGKSQKNLIMRHLKNHRACLA